jgi:hypothetical protein
VRVVSLTQLSNYLMRDSLEVLTSNHFRRFAIEELSELFANPLFILYASSGVPAIQAVELGQQL